MLLGRVFIAVWRDAPRTDQLETMFDLAQSRRKNVGDLAFLNMVIAGTPRFSADVRETTVRRVKEQPFVVTAHLLLLPGLVGSTVRAFISTLNLLARPQGPTQVFGDTDEALDWLIKRMADASIDAPTLKDLLGVVRPHSR